MQEFQRLYYEYCHDSESDELIKIFDFRSHKAKANRNAKKAQGTIKYSGAKMHEKGVILEIEGLTQNQ